MDECPSKFVSCSEHSVPNKLVWDGNIQMKRNTNEKCIRQKKVMDQNHGVDYRNGNVEMQPRKFHDAVWQDALVRDAGSGRHTHMVTVTSFGPNETIDTELW